MSTNVENQSRNTNNQSGNHPVRFGRLQCEYAVFLLQIYDNFLMYTNKVILSVAFIPIWVTVYHLIEHGDSSLQEEEACRRPAFSP